MDYSFTYNEVSKAFDDCLMHKKNTIGAKKFSLNKVSNLLQLTDEINSRTYKIGTSDAFIITDPKVREVFAAEFRDRIVHHLVIRELEPYFEEYFIPDTYSCMKGRGTLNGVLSLSRYIKTCSSNYKTPLYLAKLDFQSFFMSIDKELLAKNLDDFIVKEYPNNRKKECLRWLCQQVVLHHPELDCTKKGKQFLWKKLPDYKSLFKVSKKKGLAIGNLTSQMFANFYLTPLDLYISEVLGMELLVRYADDFVVGHSNLEYLKKCIPLIKEFARKELLLIIHPDKLYIQECNKGISFIGAVVKPGRNYCGDRALTKFRNKMVTDFSIFSGEKVDDYISSMNSYLGLIRHFKTYKIRKKYITKFNKPWEDMVYANSSYTKVIKKK